MLKTKLIHLSFFFWSISVFAVNNPKKEYSPLWPILNSQPTMVSTNQIFNHQAIDQELLEDEFDPVDVAALKAIRDKAPVGSVLKTYWSDESKLGSWISVVWTDLPPKKVKSLFLMSHGLNELDVTPFSELEILQCSYNKLSTLVTTGLKKLKFLDCSGNLLEAISIVGLDNLTNLRCSGNKIPFSRLPIRVPITGGSYEYSSQSPLFGNADISSGETIDYSSEAIIEGVSTVFKWYKNNVQIDNTDHSGKYSPISEGYYYCEMTNSKFPGLIIITSLIKVGNPPEYDLEDIIALKAIRDNAPSYSQLKYDWADESRIGSWSGVGWTQNPSKRVIYLTVQSKMLTSLDVSKLTALETLGCSQNMLTSINITGLTKLKYFACNNNKIPFSQLPLKLPVTGGTYTYLPQESLYEKSSVVAGESIDYSSEIIIDGIPTAFTWYKDNVEIKNVDQTGKYSPTSEGYYYCIMTNTKFPGLTQATTPVNLGNPPEYDPIEVAALKTIRDNAPMDSPLKTKWANEANIGTWEGVNWTNLPTKKVTKLYLYNNKLTTLDLSPFSILETVYCNANNLVLLKCEGLTKLKELQCSQNKLSFANLPLVPSLSNVYGYGSQNKLYEEREISTGETIDYSFEALLINGKPTVFSWYKDNVKIEGTDQTGKYTPTTDGYYYCVMTNAVFPQLTLTTNAVKAGTIAEFDPRDVEALKAIRDNAPATSPLKTDWADEAKVGTWSGVTWTDFKSRRVIGLSFWDKKLVELDVRSLTELVSISCYIGLNSINVQGLTKLTTLNCSSNKLTSIDLTGLIKLNSLDCSGNLLTSIDLTGLGSLKTLYCTNNKIPFSKLPLKLPVSGGYYTYDPQKPLYEERTMAIGETIDYSSEAMIGTKPTTFTWFKNGEKIEVTDQTGKYTPTSDGYYTCKMVNANFSAPYYLFELTTSRVIVGTVNEYDPIDVAALKAIRDNAPSGSRPKMYWTDDSKIRTWDGVTWSEFPPRKVTLLYLGDGNLTELDVSSLSSLKGLNCSNNYLTFLKINPLTKFDRLNCSNNKLTFSSLPLNPTVSAGEYNYTNQKLLDIERSINPGETIDYSSVALINGVETVFKWYRNNILIENTDQTGKFTTTEDGYYYCKMTNSLFPNLTLASAPIKVGNPSLYDPQDVEALKAIRDNAPVDSPLKTDWNDESKIGSWSGVTWNSLKPYQIIFLSVTNKKLTSLDARLFKSLRQLNCSNNSLTSLDLRGGSEFEYIDCQNNNLVVLNISGLAKISDLNCSNNKLTFGNIPYDNNRGRYFIYYQKPLFEEKTIQVGEIIDYSSEATINGVSTVFTWYKNEVKIENTDQTGKYSPTTEGFYTCKMTNAKFPNLVLSTSLVKVGTIEEYAPQDVATLKTIRDNAPSDSPLKTLWADESKIATWEGVTWSSYAPKKVIGLGINDKKLKEVDVRLLTALEHLNCDNNFITSLIIKDLNNLKRVYCFNNLISEIDLTGSLNVNNLHCNNNNIPLSKLPLPSQISDFIYDYEFYPQNEVFEERNIVLGEELDYTSEALIDGASTIFTWYWGDFKIEDADQSGKFTPTKDGYYSCTMTNYKFPKLTIRTKKVKVGNPEEYSSEDIEALKAIRDNAPVNSPLKTFWADETKIGIWTGVSWTNIPPRRVRSLVLNNVQLSTLNIDKLPYLGSLNCSNNNLLSIDLSGSNLNILICTYNFLTFSKIPLELPANGLYKYITYAPQKPLFEERTISAGETIDYSSESLINGSSTVFSWFRNDTKILNTDQSGKYTPTEEGYYYCTMTNPKFEGLVLTTNKVTVGNPPEFDPQDVAALKAIRDNAPASSMLKTWWADDSKIGTWSGVTWNDILPKKVKSLGVSYAGLKELNVSQLTYLEYLNCSNNQLNSVDLTGVNRLKEYDCSNNNLSFSNLLLRLPISGSYYSYNYSPQGLIYQQQSISAGETIDYSSEVLFDGVSTVFTWYRDNVKIENTNQTGKFTPISEGYYYCILTNAKFPKLILTTNVVKVGNPPEFDPQDVVSLKSIRDNAPAGSSLKNLWADDKNIGTWSGVVWSQFPIKKVKELNIRGCSLSTISITPLNSLEKLDCSNNYLTSLDLSMLPNLQSIYCSGNQLTSINIDGLTRLSTLYCQNNQLLFSKLPLKLTVQNGYYYYSGQSYPLTQQTFIIGSTIDYSSEALIDGVSTKYRWYRNGTLIADTDNTGRYTISEDGYYYCVLSNSKFPELSITTSQIKIGNPQEYDAQDILTLKTIRDNAPSDSPLKTYWADDTKIGIWTGVIWSTYLPRKVTHLSLYNMKLSVLDVKQLTALEQLNCYYNQLTILDVSGLSNLLVLNCQSNQLAFVDISTLTKLYSFDCSFNKIPLSKLPLKLPSSYGTFSYSQQTPFSEEHSISIGETIDYSSEAIISGTATTFVWYKNNVKLEGTDNSGKFIPSSEGIYYCTMNNSKFYSLTIATGKTKVGNPIEFDTLDVEALRSIRDNSPDDSPLRTAWADDRPVSSWTGIYWNGIYPQRVKQLSLSSKKLTSLDLTKLSSLETIDCTYNQLKTLKVDGLSNLTSLSCTANQLETIDLTTTPKVKSLYCEYNKISLSRLPLKLLEPGGYYRYSPQNKIYDEKTISSGELIDFSSEATIDGASTVFTWFKNNIKIENTDQSGKFVPTEDGYYYCQMTNSKFIGLTILTNTIKIGTPPEFDQQDVDALKSIRDNAPANSLLKVNWADDELIGSWTGVLWTPTLPKKVSRLIINNMQLTSLNVSKLTGLIQLYCSKNNLTTLDLSGLTLLSTIDCSYNRLSSINLTGIANLYSINCIENNFSFTTLPLLPYNIYSYYSSPQKLLFEEKTIALGETIDFSSESLVRTQPTYFTWYKDNIRIDGTDQSGKYKPTTNGVYYCTMVNYTFSNLRLTTNKIYVGTTSDYNSTDVEALKLIRDNAPADSPLKTEWADENQIDLWAGVTWRNDIPKKVVELSISAKKLKELSVVSFASLEKLNCDNNELASLNVTGLLNLSTVDCSNNKLPFSSLPVRLPVSGGTYEYSPMNLLYEERTSIAEEPINYTLESKIDGSLSNFFWYKNDVKIEGTDQTGKYIPLEEGEYHCTMTNSKFPGLTLTTNIVKVYKLPEFDMQDVEALKTLRDNSPADSPLKTQWADNGKFSTWEGVEWTSYPTKKVKNLQLSNMSLKTLDVTSFSGLEQLYCNNNQLTSLKISGLLNLNYLSCTNNLFESIDIAGLPKIKNLFCHNNRISFSKLPIKLSVSGGNFQYWPQGLVFDERIIAVGETIDFSSESLINGKSTVFNWYKNNILISGTDQSGKYKITGVGYYHCVMTNTNFPGLTITTNKVITSILHEFDPGDVAVLKTIRDNSPTNALIRAKWNDNSNLNNWLGVKWSAISPKRVVELDISNDIISSIDIAGLTQLEVFKCTNNLITSINLQGLNKLMTLNCERNKLSSIDLTGLPSMSLLICAYNKIPLSKLFPNLEIMTSPDYYSPQNLLYNEYTLEIGDIIDYSSEALIGGISTNFSWYLNGDKINGTDQTGKYIPISEGVYSCSMTNSRIPGLTLTTSPIKVMTPVEYDPQDLAELIALRDKAPENSSLKTEWANEANVGTWAGVSWNSNYPKRVVELQLVTKGLNALDVTKFTMLRALYCNNNILNTLNISGLLNLQRIDCQHNHLSLLDISGLSALSELNCNNNDFSFRSLPINLLIAESNYHYSPQNLLFEEHSIHLGETIDYSSEAIIDGVATVFTWYKDNVKIEGTAPNGKYAPSSRGIYHCVMTNEKFPNLTLQTNNITALNESPVAVAGPDQSVDELTLVTLEGSASFDYDNDKLTYIWTSPSGIALSSSSASNPTFIAPEVTMDTSFTILLIVNDGYQNSMTDEVVITVKQVNKVPIANAGINQILNEGRMVTLYGTSSFDADGDNITYVWTTPAGITLNSSNAAQPWFTAPNVSQDTSYTFTLVVNDGKTNSTPSEVIVTVKPIQTILKLVAKTNNVQIPASELVYKLFLKNENAFLEKNMPHLISGDTTQFSVDSGEWIVLVSSNQNISTFIPTYVGDVENWSNAEHIIMAEGPKLYKEINTIQPILTSGGVGQISGLIVEDNDPETKSISIYTDSGETKIPVNGALVHLYRKGEETPILSIFSDSLGYYKFDRLAIADYDIVVELPGFMQSEKFGVKVSEDEPLISIQFAVNTISQTITDVDPMLITAFKIYPNPVLDRLNIDIEENSGNDPLLFIYDFKGDLLMQKILARSSSVIDFSKYRSGSYLIKLIIGKEIRSLVILKR